jgi:hypothetical protein
MDTKQRSRATLFPPKGVRLNAHQPFSLCARGGGLYYICPEDFLGAGQWGWRLRSAGFSEARYSS